MASQIGNWSYNPIYRGYNPIYNPTYRRYNPT